MDFIDHPILYSDDYATEEWQEILEQSKGKQGFWRRYARRKMRRVARELLKGIRPRINYSV